MRCLNLYAGLGGNRKLWTDCEVTAVEYNEEVATVYSHFYPQDRMIIGDAHAYLEKHYKEFDFIWTSPPCPTHSQFQIVTGNQHPRRFPSMVLYEEILFLKHYFKGLFLVENVKPFYEPLVAPTHIVGRHYFWSNVCFNAPDIQSPKEMERMLIVDWESWLDFKVPDEFELKAKLQKMRNCVHPKMGFAVFEAAKKTLLYRTEKNKGALEAPRNFVFNKFGK